MDKTELIKSINEIKNIPIAPLKDKLTDNSDNNKFMDLMQYNVMLDNITIGIHTKTTIKYAGIEWNLRLLSAEEYINIRKSIIEQCKKEDLFDDWYSYYLAIIKFLEKALTSSPFKTDGMFNEVDLKTIHFDVLEEIYKQYLHFVNIATKKPDEMTDAEVEAFINIAKKKPEVLREYERPKLLTTALWFLNYSQQLEKMLKLDTNNSPSSN